MLAEACEETCEKAHVGPEAKRREVKEEKERAEKKTGLTMTLYPLFVKPPIEFKERERGKRSRMKIQEAKEP